MINVGGDEPMSVRDLAGEVAKVMGVPIDILWLPSRKEVQNAHCSHELARKRFPRVYSDMIDIATGLKLMSKFVHAHQRSKL